MSDFTESNYCYILDEEDDHKTPELKTRDISSSVGITDTTMFTPMFCIPSITLDTIEEEDERYVRPPLPFKNGRKFSV